ncbi:MAG: undecaprenyl-diphosphate phosphatase [Bacillota bacterium]
MSLTWAAILGAVQGLTEFLPVSSSGHLVILQGLAGLKMPGVTFEIAVHLGTLLAVLIALWGDVRSLLVGLWRPSPGRRRGGRQGGERQLLAALLVALVPTGVIGLAGKDFFERLFDSPRAAALALLLTGLILVATPALSRGHTGLFRVKGRQALAVGGAQGLAIVPGLSRSGLTIAAGLACGLEPDAAARFSFLLSIPAILGAAGVDALDALKGGPSLAATSLLPGPLLVGALTATLVGAVSVRWMLDLVRRGRLRPFAYYCWAVGLLTLVLTYLAGL